MRKVLYLQLPRLDNEARGRTENLPLAGRYLDHALGRSGIRTEARFVTDEASDATLLDQIGAWKPDVVAATLYLWNVERTLCLMAAIRRRRPGILLCAGGPEVARDHPFLFRSGVPDAVVAGEGEAVFPSVLRALEALRRRGGAASLRAIPTGADWENVAWRVGRRYAWGRRPPPPFDLAAGLPPPSHPCWTPDGHGMGWVEAGRGCPLRCAYCRYPPLRRRLAFVPVRDVLARIRTLRSRGAREIRFIDPSLGAHPDFDGLLDGLARMNRRAGRDRRLPVFGELLAERLTQDQIGRLRAAGFTDIEAGVQSRDPAVLRAIHRPGRLDALDANVRRLGRAGIRVTLDLMYGLPGQHAREVLRSLRAAWRRPRTHVQCLQTLLLPGTELRARRREWGLVADDRPPYGVRGTPTMSAEDMCRIETAVFRHAPADSPTRRFVGRRLPDLFTARVVCDSRDGFRTSETPRAARTAMIFRGDDLWARRGELLRAVRRARRDGPHALWQFVLRPAGEEPLDLLDLLIDELRKWPRLWLDRLGAAAARDQLASRRVFVLLRRGGTYSRAWVNEAEALLGRRFY